MTNEEMAKSILMEIECGYISYGNLHGEHRQGMRVIKNALEKSVAKKAKLDGRAYYCDCGNFLLWDNEVPNESDRYCGKCGQRWEYEYDE